MKTSFLLSLAGGIGTAVSAFLPAYSVSFLGISVSTSFMDADTRKAYILLGFGVVTLVLSILARNKTVLGWGTLAAGAVTALLGISWFSQLSQLGATGFGIYIIILSGVLAVAGGLMAARGK